MNKVSVIIPVYNPNISLLDRAVRSVQEQLYTDFELLLIDDCSTDQRVLAYLEKQSADDRIRVIHQKENGGVSEARNRGILEAVGEWIAFLDQDDYYCPDFLSSLLAEADNAEIDMLMAGFYLVQGGGDKGPVSGFAGSFSFSLADLVHLCGLESYLSKKSTM